MSFRQLLILMCIYLGLTLSGLHAMAALLPTFIEIWDLTNTEAGWLNSSQYLAYVAAVPIIAFSERIDAKRLLLTGTLFNVVGYLGFALLADGLWSAVAFRVLQGIGFAFTYMPGVKAITDRVSAKNRGRGASIYVSSFATTTSFSIIIAGMIADAFGWRAAFILPTITNIGAFVLILFFLQKAEPEVGDGPRRALFDFRDEFSDPRMRGFIIAATMHTLELLAVRGWTVVMLVVVSERWSWLNHETILIIATFLVLIGMPCSMAGGELGHRKGFAYASALAMALSALSCSAVGFAIDGPLWLFVFLVLMHNVFVLADSGALNGGAADAAKTGRRGAAVTLMAFANALGSLVGPVLFGFMLDLGGGRQESFAWGIAFLTISGCVMAGVAALIIGMRRYPRKLREVSNG